MTEAAETGTLKFYNRKEGYGFIAPDFGGKDVFLHVTALKAAKMNPLSMVDGQRLGFKIATRNGKMHAADVVDLTN